MARRSTLQAEIAPEAAPASDLTRISGSFWGINMKSGPKRAGDRGNRA